jgi:hypothetical protein
MTASAVLCCHEATPCDAIRVLRVLLRRTTDKLSVYFRLDGNIAGVSLLSPDDGSVAELWRHTCFEIFVAADPLKEYYEFNFAPSREWRQYAFRGYRALVSSNNVLSQPIIAVNIGQEWVELEATIALIDLFGGDLRLPLFLGLSAVIESADGSLSYWALHHPAGKPDFHHPDAFALRLDAPREP